jgi:hypothetical protein
MVRGHVSHGVILSGTAPTRCASWPRTHRLLDGCSCVVSADAVCSYKLDKLGQQMFNTYVRTNGRREAGHGRVLAHAVHDAFHVRMVAPGMGDAPAPLLTPSVLLRSLLAVGGCC